MMAGFGNCSVHIGVIEIPLVGLQRRYGGSYKSLVTFGIASIIYSTSIRSAKATPSVLRDKGVVSYEEQPRAERFTRT